MRINIDNAGSPQEDADKNIVYRCISLLTGKEMAAPRQFCFGFIGDMHEKLLPQDPSIAFTKKARCCRRLVHRQESNSVKMNIDLLHRHLESRVTRAVDHRRYLPLMKSTVSSVTSTISIRECVDVTLRIRYQKAKASAVKILSPGSAPAERHRSSDQLVAQVSSAG